ncbi:MAG: hypothetical protein WAQ52_07475 [Terriglobales bacterium]
MTFSWFAIVVLALSGLQIFAAAQNPPAQGTNEARPTPAPALSGIVGVDNQVPEVDTGADIPLIPALLGGPRTSLAFTSEMERSNYLRGGLNVGAAYDDNALLVPTGEVGNASYSVFPNIAIEQSTSRMSWKLEYAAGLTVNQRLSNRNQGSHDLNFDSQFRLSPHVSLRVAEDFSLASGFFDSGAGGLGVGNGGPNANLALPLAKQRSSVTVAEANYHFALKDVIGASGSFYDLHFSDVPAGFALANTRTAAGSAFWLHGLFGRDWAGISYRFQRLTFDPNGETRVHSIMAVNTLKLPNRFTVTSFIGPEHSDNQGLFPAGGGTAHFSDWSVAGGVEVGWQKDHTSVAGGYSRQISDGGGILGVVRLQGIHGDVRQQLLPGWAVAVGASYGKNESLTVPFEGSAGKINSSSVGVSLERNLGRSLGLRVGYNHDFQEQFGGALPGPAHRNRVSVTLGYQWYRPLGR